MKLVLKQPKDKPPFIGIQFSNTFHASRTNDDLVGNDEYELILEPHDKRSISLRLVNKDKMIDRIYKDVEYSGEKLRAWLEVNKEKRQFNFSHVILDYDKHIVVKAGAGYKNFIIRLRSVRIFSEL